MADDYSIEAVGDFQCVGADDYWVDVVEGRPLSQHRRRHSFHRIDREPLFFTIGVDEDTGRLVKRYDDDTDEWRTTESVEGFFDGIVKAVKSVAHDVAHTVNTVAKVAGHAVTSIPVVGGAIQAVVNVVPVKAIGGFVSSVARGERIDKAFLAAGKAELHGIKGALPYAQKILSFVPGVGTGIASGIAAATAIADGRSITDAVQNAVLAAVPGGSLGAVAARAAAGVVHGDRLDTIALNAAKQAVPQAAQAIDIAIKAGKGKDGVLQAIRAVLPPEAQRAVDIGTALGVAKNIQGTTARGVQMPSAQKALAGVGSHVIAASPVLRNAVRAAPPKMSEGFRIAAGLAAHKGVTPQAILAARSKLSPEAQAGFDHGLKTIANAHNPQWQSVVTDGKVYRGNFKAATKSTPGASFGRLVSGGTVRAGYWCRA